MGEVWWTTWSPSTSPVNPVIVFASAYNTDIVAIGDTQILSEMAADARQLCNKYAANMLAL